MDVALDPARSGAPAILMLDVGQGDATAIVLPGKQREAIVVDCNDAYVVLRHLEAWRVESLRCVVFTHLDLDHIRGGLELLRAWRDRIQTVYIDTDGRRLGDDVAENQRAKTLFDEVISMEGREGRPGPQLLPPLRGLTLASGEDWRVHVIAPFHGASMSDVRDGSQRSTNEHSAVVLVERSVGGNRRAVLVGGDAPLSVWAAIPAAERGADVFRIPHHGGALDKAGEPENWDADRLYDEVEPEHAVVSVGTTNGHGHPAPEWRAPLANRSRCHVWCTQVTQACHASIAEPEEAVRRRKLIVEGRWMAEPPWRHLTEKRGHVKGGKDFGEVPCAGTVAVGLGADGELYLRPRQRDHDNVVESWGSPWCRGEEPDVSDSGGGDEFKWLEALLSG